MQIEAVKGDITLLEVDAIVNAANRALAGGGGVDGAIHRAAGAAELHEACAKIGHCDPGDAVATPGFKLPARWIIHTVGPVWHGGNHNEAAILESCYRKSIEIANGLLAKVIAFPAISTGVYGYPPEQAARIVVDTLRSIDSSIVERSLLVAFDDSTFRIYTELLNS
jgi:O-acetyl-ADP-ribose deacetylase (regulator of RNase III)